MVWHALLPPHDVMQYTYTLFSSFQNFVKGFDRMFAHDKFGAGTPLMIGDVIIRPQPDILLPFAQESVTGETGPINI